jgi:antirestriction protein ArdC
MDDTVLKPLVERVQSVDSFVDNTQAIIEHGNTGAFYRPSEDKIYMPKAEVFIDTDACTATEGYYSTLLHELVHWTGSPTRLDRTKGKKFGDHDYAVEELVAELGAAFLCAEFDIAIAEKGDHANYIASWMKVLKENKYAIISAASEASKAVGYMKKLTVG